MKRNYLSTNGKMSPKEHFREKTSKFINRFSRRGPLKLFFLFLALVVMLFNGANGLSKFTGRTPKEHSCDIVSKSNHWFSRRGRFKLLSIYSSGGHLVQQSGTV